MTLQKAIELLSQTPYLVTHEEEPDFKDAIKLGIKALEWRALMEHDYGSWCGPPLPGEDPIFDNTRSLHTIKRILESPLVRPEGD